MRYLDLTLPTPEENLALEEALLEQAEASIVDGGEPLEILRLWESTVPFVVMGAGSPIHTDVNLPECARLGVPVLRRCSGGGTVMQGPGSLNYTLVLDMLAHPGVETIKCSNQTVLKVIINALTACGVPGATIQGTSDITLGDRKFSGNSQRRRKRFILFHGTILYNYDLALIEKCLGRPERIPDYREGREHKSFVMNIDVNAHQLRSKIAELWNANEPLIPWPISRTAELAAGRYSDQAWIASL